MSADARVARAIQQVRTVRRSWPDGVPPDIARWLGELDAAVTDLIDETADALHLTDTAIANY